MTNDTIVLIHGYGFDSHTWAPIAPAFVGFQTLYFSLPGFDGQQGVEPYTIAQLAERFWADLDARHIDTVHLAGHSMGGYTVMEMAAQQPSRVLSVAMIHSHVFADSDEKKKARTATLEDIKANGREALVKKMIPSMFADPAAHEDLISMLVARGLSYDDSAWYAGTYALRERRDHADTLRRLTVPVLMIMGARDNAVPEELALKQAPYAERTTFHLYPACGHMGMHENTIQMKHDLSAFYRQFA